MTDQELEGAFETMNAKDGLLNPMQFSNLLRLMDVSHGNLKMELDLFHLFDKENSGAVDENEFKIGVRGLIETKGLHNPEVAALIKGIRQYHSQGTIAL